jgi:hypothetical protein|tara:strand:- start:6175 stop:6330 length:156 start_codon:yes stop_codon:yes gene_type:complete
MMLKDPSEREIPVMFVDDGEICEHGQLGDECKLCYDEMYAEDHIDELKEGD